MNAATPCIPNIGPRGRRRRMGFGIVILVLAALAAVALFQVHAPRIWRVALFLPFWLGALGVFQAAGNT
jgi:hypothetical protein